LFDRKVIRLLHPGIVATVYFLARQTPRGKPKFRSSAKAASPRLCRACPQAPKVAARLPDLAGAWGQPPYNSTLYHSALRLDELTLPRVRRTRSFAAPRLWRIALPKPKPPNAELGVKEKREPSH
jgi:hypothetical protein